MASPFSGAITRDWGFGDSTGAGVRVCIVDSGVEAGHPLVGDVEQSVVVEVNDGVPDVHAETPMDICGHGTACASVVRALAPDCRLSSVRVLGAGFRGSGEVLLAGLRWAVAQRFDVVNLSVSTSKRQHAEALYEVADAAYFGRTLLVASAHNMPVTSYPWTFASVMSVGSHDLDDRRRFFYNPAPPVEFFARGVNVEVAWSKGRTIVTTGNSFATPHMSGLAALVLARRPGLTPAGVKAVLQQLAHNVHRDG